MHIKTVNMAAFELCHCIKFTTFFIKKKSATNQKYLSLNMCSSTWLNWFLLFNVTDSGLTSSTFTISIYRDYHSTVSVKDLVQFLSAWRFILDLIVTINSMQQIVSKNSDSEQMRNKTIKQNRNRNAQWIIPPAIDAIELAVEGFPIPQGLGSCTTLPSSAFSFLMV